MNALAKYLKESGRSAMEFSRSVGAAPSQISRLLSGERGPSIPLALEIERETDGAVPVASWVKKGEGRR